MMINKKESWIYKHPVLTIVAGLIALFLILSFIKGIVSEGSMQDIKIPAVTEKNFDISQDAYSQPKVTNKGEGYSRDNPAPHNETLKTTLGIRPKVTAEYTLLDIKRGDEAWNIIVEQNQFNSPPQEGNDYILVKMRFHLISTSDNSAYTIPWTIFKTVSENGIGYEGIGAAGLILPEPELLYKEIFPGVTYEGWTVFEVAKDDEKPILQVNYPGITDNLWFELY